MKDEFRHCGDRHAVRLRRAARRGGPRLPAADVPEPPAQEEKGIWAAIAYSSPDE